MEPGSIAAALHSSVIRVASGLLTKKHSKAKQSMTVNLRYSQIKCTVG
jgi:hypothetical protein